MAFELNLPIKINDPVLIVGGGPVSDGAFDTTRALCKKVIAADGGADAILARGGVPDLVVGDMDSLSDAARAVIPSGRIVEIAEQETTDFDKALRSVEAPLVLALGFTGGRMDHELAAFHVLARQSARAIIMVGEEDLILHTPHRLSLDLGAQTRLSLFPLAQVHTQATGLMWPKGPFDIRFDPLTRIGTSNTVAQSPVQITTDRPGLLTILPRSALDAAIAALALAVFHSHR